MADVKMPYSTILLATDGSREAHRATAHALHLARGLGAKLYAVYVVDAPRTQSLGIHYREGLQELRGEGKDIVDGVLQQAKELGVAAQGLFAEGSPGEQICKVAAERQADIIVMGAKGKSDLEEILFGSVSEHVLHNSKRPVLVVRG